MIKEKKNLFYFQSMEETSCSNCKLQGKGWTEFWTMECGCSCGESVYICRSCAEEHARNNYFPPETDEPPCFICRFFKCKQGICDPSRH